MDTALLVGLSRQMAARREMDVIANNLANLTTTSFKSESILFQEYMVELTNEDGSNQNVSMVLDVGVARDFTEGRLEHTSNPFDFAISGDGWFQVETEDGVRYTRNGQFRTNEDGELTTQEGYPVLSADGDTIVLFPEDGAPSVSRSGVISSADGQPIATLGVFQFTNNDGLMKAGNSLYETDLEPEVVERPIILQGTLESSNVVAIEQMTRMIDVSRSYTSVSKMLEKSDELTRETIRKLADTQA